MTDSAYSGDPSSPRAVIPTETRGGVPAQSCNRLLLLASLSTGGGSTVEMYMAIETCVSITAESARPGASDRCSRR